MENNNTSLFSAGLTRARRSAAPLMVLCGAFGLFAGCASEPDSHVVSAPPPPVPVTTTTTTYTTNNSNMPAPVTVVTQAPPALQVEAVSAQPTSDHVWLPGYWTWRNDRYEWVAGHWALPPRSTATWIAPRWERTGNAYRFYEGYWN